MRDALVDRPPDEFNPAIGGDRNHACRDYLCSAVRARGTLGMIPQSGNRFSDKIMLEQKAR
jgi:hypothetical protein